MGIRPFFLFARGFPQPQAAEAHGIVRAECRLMLPTRTIGTTLHRQTFCLYLPLQAASSGKAKSDRYKLSLSSWSNAWPYVMDTGLSAFHLTFKANKKRLQQSILIVTAVFLRNRFATPRKREQHTFL